MSEAPIEVTRIERIRRQGDLERVRNRQPDNEMAKDVRGVLMMVRVAVERERHESWKGPIDKAIDNLEFVDRIIRENPVVAEYFAKTGQGVILAKDPAEKVLKAADFLGGGTNVKTRLPNRNCLWLRVYADDMGWGMDRFIEDEYINKPGVKVDYDLVKQMRPFFHVNVNGKGEHLRVGDRGALLDIWRNSGFARQIIKDFAKREQKDLVGRLIKAVKVK